MTLSRSKSYRSRNCWRHWWLKVERRAEARVDAQLRKFPPLHSVVRWLWITYRWAIFCCKLWLALFKSDTRAVDIDKTLWLSPEKIAYCTLYEFDIYNFKGRVIGGEWDRLEKRFEDLDVYIAFKQVFMELS